MTELRQVDPSVWRASAGTTVAVPVVGSRVYYFPEGHWEQSSQPSPSTLSPLPPMISCRVSDVVFLANPETDEVFARIRLMPYPRGAPEGGDVAVPEFNTDTVSFAKVLTPSDANNGGGFSVPRFCADSVFPLLDFNADPPVQNITIRDVHGVGWEFRHIYRGTPRRHLLTTGWSKFVNNKKLVAGDSVVFMRNVSSGELSVGIRRGVRWGMEGGGRGRVTPESVAEAADLAARGVGFEVVYYPRVGWGDFVVGAEAVEESLNTFWSVGMKVKMAMETEDSSRMTWFQGTVSAAVDTGPWRGSPWKMLEVAWDEPEYLQHLKRVSPWQVEHVMLPSLPHCTQHPIKKSRINPRSQNDEVHDLPFPILGLSNSFLGNLNSSMMSYCSLPAGMQGARQSQLFSSRLSNIIDENTNVETYGKKMNMSIKVKSLSTEPNIQSSQSEILSPDSQSSGYLLGTEIVGKQGCVSSRKTGLSSIKLFGKTIHVNDLPESNTDDTLSLEGNGNKLIEEAESVKNFLGTLTVAERNLLDGIDYQMLSAPATETFPL